MNVKGDGSLLSANPVSGGSVCAARIRTSIIKDSQLYEQLLLRQINIIVGHFVKFRDGWPQNAVTEPDKY